MKRIIDKTVMSKSQPGTTNVLWFQPETKMLHIYLNGEWIPIGGEGGSGENGSTQMKFVKEVPTNANPNVVYVVYEDED